MPPKMAKPKDEQIIRSMNSIYQNGRQAVLLEINKSLRCKLLYEELLEEAKSKQDETGICVFNRRAAYYRSKIYYLKKSLETPFSGFFIEGRYYVGQQIGADTKTQNEESGNYPQLPPPPPLPMHNASVISMPNSKTPTSITVISLRKSPNGPPPPTFYQREIRDIMKTLRKTKNKARLTKSRKINIPKRTGKTIFNRPTTGRKTKKMIAPSDITELNETPVTQKAKDEQTEENLVEDTFANPAETLPLNNNNFRRVLLDKSEVKK